MRFVNKFVTCAAMLAMTAYCSTAFAQDGSGTKTNGANGDGVATSNSIGDSSGNVVTGVANANGNCANGTCSGANGGFGNDGNCGPRPHTPCPTVPPSTDCIGAVGPNGQRYMPARAVGLAVQNPFSPQPFYTYGSAGLDATRMDNWNRNTMAPQYSWHGNYNYWRYGQPTALVVPPTAAFQTEYNWGVAQTRSMPIYHQYDGGIGAGVGAASGGARRSRNTPYWPSSTSQFGIYPVRGPW